MKIKLLAILLIIIFSFSLSYGQTVTDVSNKLSPLTKTELSEVSTQIDIILIKTTEKLIESKDSPNGQLLRKYQTFDRGGKKIGGRIIEWTYYLSGPVDIITITEMDSIDKIISIKKLKHYTDGRQPKLIK